MVLRIALTGLVFVGWAGVSDVALAQRETGPSKRSVAAPNPKTWVTQVVTRITQAAGMSRDGDPEGSVTIRIRVGADGTVEGAAVEESSGSPALDARAVEAAKAAAPFTPPPPKLLTLEGFTELSFPVDFMRPPPR